MKYFLTEGPSAADFWVIEKGDVYEDGWGEKVVHALDDPLIAICGEESEDIKARYRWNTLENFPAVAHGVSGSFTTISAELFGEHGNPIKTIPLMEIIELCKAKLGPSLSQDTGRRIHSQIVESIYAANGSISDIEFEGIEHSLDHPETMVEYVYVHLKRFEDKMFEDEERAQGSNPVFDVLLAEVQRLIAIAPWEVAPSGNLGEYVPKATLQTAAQAKPAKDESPSPGM